MEIQDRPMDEVEAEEEAIQQYIQNMQDQIQDIQDRILHNGQFIQEVRQVEQDPDVAQHINVIANDMIRIQDDILIMIDEIQNGQYRQEIIHNHQDIIYDLLNAHQNFKDSLKNVQLVVQNILNVPCEYDDNYRDFGDGWFRWEDWRIDEDFMEKFYDFLDRMMDKDKALEEPTEIIDLNPIAQMLHRKKRDDASYGQLNIDQVIRFLNSIGIKYWYAVNTCHYDPYEAINTLKVNAFMTNSQYIEFLKRNPT